MTRTTRIVVVTLLATLLPSFAMAANLFDIPQGDISIKVLGALFGGLLDTGGNDPLLNGIKIFNGGCLIIGGILAAYTILAGTLNTAHDGEMLGKKFSSVWIPVRYSVGTALVLPVVGGGYCVMQALVMWLVVQGIGLADGVWSAFMSNPTSAANTNVTSQREKILTVAKNAFQNSICYQSYARTIGESPSILKFGQYNYSAHKTSTGWVYGDSTSMLRVNGCGQVNYPAPIEADSTIRNTTPSTNSGYLGDFGTIFAPMDISAINQAQITETDNLAKAMDDLAKTVIATAPARTNDGAYGVSLTPEQAQGYYNQIETATDNYLSKMKTAANGLSTTDAYSRIQQTASNQGWILAGAWFTRIIQMNNSINKAIDSTPTSKAGTGGWKDSTLFADSEKYMAGATQVLAAAPNASAPPDIDSSAGSSSNSSGAEVVDVSGGMEASVTKALTTINLYELKNDSRHPLVIMNELGNRLIKVVFAAMALLTAAAGATGVVAGWFNAGGAVSAVIGIMGWFVDVPVKILMGTGMGAAYILPNMPFILWIGCIAGWVLLVIEAIIAAPLWAIMHLHPNGDDLTGRGGNGYSLVLSLLLRPVLMVFGMEAAIVISAVIGEFINKTFFEVFAQNTGTFTGWSEITALAMGTTVYCIVMFIFIKKCFGIIHQLPDQMLQWIGGGGSQLGQFAGEFAHAQEKGGAAGAAGGGFAASSIAKVGAAGAGKIKQGVDRKVRGDLAELDNEEKGFAATAGEGAMRERNSNESMRADLDPNAMFKNNTYSKQRVAQNREAYNEAFRQVGDSAPNKEAAQAKFAKLFRKADRSGFSAYGGSAVKAAQQIGAQLVKENLDMNLSKNPDNSPEPTNEPDKLEIDPDKKVE
ncbi:DotA/TraY family protein [Burkholderia cenocepacia]|uniref:DotA/TraY family protein n=1 Tax=Burkholderia cenocepacia TaxID=95486 RepID=A0A1V2VW19_9BURK|nr:DotA/TraY family protein [Burkholderia cenocepacia]ONU48841.1 hypothetical protein A8E66_04390 [Burkholderia cenocepacia]ONU51761.1 hypothetical protein A8E62_26415 [Burkholderia cenocepacia]ONU53506.1 hypothetical protein A8E68_37300 [Burkholderia cenocepacia]ONU66497.1 hypothetical protein A8E67_07515 [Burkholderia cenocepacia]ONU71912.1 hypothetical protein A8E63_40015 [Burkholderia cenocepacia]